MDSLFATLAGGTRFNRKKYSQDVELFQSKPVKPSKSSNPASKELDFFGDAEIPREVEESDKEDSQDETIQNSSSEPLTKQQAEILRKKRNIRVTGDDIPLPISTFSQLKQLQPWLTSNIVKSYSQPTPIQMQAIPIMLSRREIIACAPTGSGKTMAYLIPLLHLLQSPIKKLKVDRDLKSSGFRAVIVSPTRELAQQIYREATRLSQGKSFKIFDLTSIKSLEDDAQSITGKFKNSDILITTPMRLVHALETESLTLNNVQYLVLDEADRLLDLGFAQQVDAILAACPHQSLVKSLFSATFPSNVEELANSIMTDPIRCVIGLRNAATATIDQKLVYVGEEEGKLVEIRQMVQRGEFKPPVLIFVQSIERAKELFNELVYDGINVDVMHSDRTRAQRDNIVSQFRQGKIWVLICTELMSRGIDFKGVNLVINYDFPQSVASYIHRIGRTGRAGRRGSAVTFFTKSDSLYLKAIVQVMRDSGCEVPEWMLKLEKPSKLVRRLLKKTAPNRTTISTTSKFDVRKRKHRQDVIANSKKKRLEL